MCEISKGNKNELKRNLNCIICPSPYEELVNVSNGSIVSKINQMSFLVNWVKITENGIGKNLMLKN